MPERSAFFRTRGACLGLCLILALTACAPQRNEPIGPGESLPPLARLDHGVWVFRHRVHFVLPEQQLDLGFDGVMRLDTAGRNIHVVGLGGLGLRLFDLRLTPDGVTDAYLHPSLRKLPRATERIAWCVRRIWFDCLTLLPPAQAPGTSLERALPKLEETGYVRVHEVRDGIAMDHTFARSRLVSSRAEGGETWNLEASEYTDTDPWPRLVRFDDRHGRYILTIRLLRAEQELTR